MRHIHIVIVLHMVVFLNILTRMESFDPPIESSHIIIFFIENMIILLIFKAINTHHFYHNLLKIVIECDDYLIPLNPTFFSQIFYDNFVFKIVYTNYEIKHDGYCVYDISHKSRTKMNTYTNCYPLPRFFKKKDMNDFLVSLSI